MKNFAKQFRPAIMIFIAMTLICGVLYTGIITGLAQLIFPYRANGSIVTVTLRDGTVQDYGSALIEQKFTRPQYLIGRPMILSNLAPFSAKQASLVSQRVAWWHSFDPANTAPIPSDLITGSGSGVDPDISPAAADYQVARIAKARNMSEDAVRAVIHRYTTGRLLDFIGEPAVNVLQVNLALDGLI